MPVATTLSRIGRFEFFAILAPGVCLVAVVTIFLTACMVEPSIDAGQAMTAISNQIKNQWPFGVVILLFAYLVGSILRAIPVGAADGFCGYLFKWTAIRGYDHILYVDDFPYGAMLEKQLAALQMNDQFDDVTLPADGTSHTIFNMWKLILCDRSPGIFEYAQDLEGRVRLFSGMIWVAVPSGVLGIIGCFLSRRCGCIHPSWFPIMTGMAVASFLFFFLLGWRLRRVRAEEVQVIFFGIVNCRLRARDPEVQPKSK